MYALVSGDTIAEYPYTIGMLRKDNPNTSFPKTPTDELLSQWGMIPVAKTARPTVDHTKNVIEGDPVFADAAWTQVWDVVDASAEEIIQRVNQHSLIVRSKRNSMLSKSDWTQLPDAPVDRASWETYRQQLRDLTDHPSFPFLSDENWPVAPE